MSDAAQKLKDLRARAAELSATLEARKDDDALAFQIKQAEQDIVDKQAIIDAIEKYGPLDQKIRVVQTDGGVVILKKANPNIFRRFQDSESTETEDLDKLVRPSVVYPAPAQFDALLDEYPMTLMRCANAVSWLAGARKEDLAKK